MKRRTFIQSLAAVFALPAAPALSLPGASAVAPAAAAVPTQARFWAIYMSALHGECTPQTLTNLLHIPETDAKRYVGQLIADGVIKPNPLLRNTVSELAKPKDESLLDKAKKRLEKKSEAKAANSPDAELQRAVQPDAEAVQSSEHPNDDPASEPDAQRSEDTKPDTQFDAESENPSDQGEDQQDETEIDAEETVDAPDATVSNQRKA